MCGIVGYVGPRPVADILFGGLERLEYRGYDSAGLAVFDGEATRVVRSVGKLANLATALKQRPLVGTVGIGHTRWATHGRPSEENAHPHTAGPITVVHNGIIENHLALRAALQTIRPAAALQTVGAASAGEPVVSSPPGPDRV